MIFIFYPSAADGVPFDAELIPVDGHVVIPTEGPVAFIPKAALPDGVYTVTITMGTPPAEAPEGYGLIGGVTSPSCGAMLR